MATNTGLLQASPELPREELKPYTKRLVIILAALIFMAEVVSMIVLYFVKLPNYFWHVLMDASLMLMLVLPGLYLLHMRPLNTQIAKRDHVERALRSNEDLLRKVLELLPVGVLVVDRNGKIVHDNPLSKQIWGPPRTAGNELPGNLRGWWANSGKQVGPDEWASIRALKHGKTSLNDEIEIEANDGSRKMILNSAVPILDEAQAILGAVIVNQDITNRRTAEKERNQLNELLDRFFSSISTLLAYMDRDFNFIRVNDTYAKTGGHPPEFYIGKNHFDLFPYPENETIFSRVVETGEPFSVLERKFEFAEFPERGPSYWDWSLQPVNAPDGEVEGVVLSLVDVTERKLADLKLANQNEELRALYHSEAEARQFAETLREASQALTETLDLEYVMNTLLEHLEMVVSAELAIVTLLEDESHLAVRAARHYQDCCQIIEDIFAIPINSLTDSVLQRLKLSPKSIMIADTPIRVTGEQPACLEQVSTWLVVPITASNKIIGLVELGRSKEDTFTQEQTSRAEALVAQAAVAIQNAWLFERARASSERLQILSNKLVEVQEKEREYIARELHDESGQALSSIKLGLGRLEQDNDCPEGIKERLKDLKVTVDDVLEDLHRMALDLRPVALDRLGLVAALQQYTNQVNQEGLSIQFKAIGLGDRRLPREVEIAIYRIVQEATTNAIRHAQASFVSILLERGDKIKVLIEDDGIGFDPAKVDLNEHIGLAGIRERAEMLGGRLSIESAADKGTTIEVEVPYEHSNFDR